MALIGPALDTIGQFVSDIAKKFEGADTQLTAKVGGFMEYIEQVFQKIMGADPESLMVSFRRTLDLMYNGVLDMSMRVIDTMLLVGAFINPDKFTPEHVAAERERLLTPLAKQKMLTTEDKDSLIDRFNITQKSDEQIAQELRATAVTSERKMEAETIIANLPQLREHQEKRGMQRRSSLDPKTNTVKETVSGSGDTETLVTITDLQSAIPGFPSKYTSATAVVDQDGFIEPGSVLVNKPGGGSDNAASDLNSEHFNALNSLMQMMIQNPDAIGQPLDAPTPEETTTVPLSQMVPPKPPPAPITTPPVKTTPASAYQNFMNLNQQLGIPMPTVPSISLNQGGSAFNSSSSKNFYGIDFAHLKGGYSTIKPK